MSFISCYVCAFFIILDFVGKIVVLCIFFILFVSAEQNFEIFPTEYICDSKTKKVIYGGGEKKTLKRLLLPPLVSRHFS